MLARIRYREIQRFFGTIANLWDNRNFRSGWKPREMARPERFELPTNWFEASYSIQLSYGRVESGL